MAEPEEEDDITPEQEKYESEHPDRPSDNPSVARCVRAWNRAYHKKLKELDEDDDDTEYEANEAGKRYFLRAMPPLAGYVNIRDFIACITYAELLEIIRHTEAVHYFEAAKFAVGALQREPKSADFAMRRLGRPPKTAEIQEIK